MDTPLDGLLVADFSRVLAGPYASMLLGDLGADVIKVERPGTGDDTRAWGPPWRQRSGGEGEARDRRASTYFLGLNRNKRSVALDLADPGDRALARRLGERADVLIESFRPGLMASWGLDGDSLRVANPRLVSCSVTAFGSGEARMPGYDFLLQAMGGLMSVTGEPDGRPLKVGAALIDLVCGLLAAIGIEAALAERERTGRGRHVDVSLMDSALASLLNQGSAWVSGGVIPSRRGNRHPSIVPYETYEAADRPFAVAAGNDRLFARLCEAVGLPELAADPRFATNEARVENVDALGERLESAFRTRPAAHWLSALGAVGVPVGPINRVDEAFALAADFGLDPVEDHHGLPLIRPPLRLDGERPPIRRPPPQLDEHGAEIRAWLGTTSREEHGFVDVLAFVRAALPPPPARVLEIGAGGGELAAALADAGYDVVAIDPAGQVPEVLAVPLHELEAPRASFDAAVAVVSLHHVEPLAESCRRLAELVRPGGALVVDEFDVERFDERAARWLLQRRGEGGDPTAMVANLREHLHTIPRLRAALSPWFELGEPVPCAYLYRWYVPPGLRVAEEALIAAGELPATGVRLVGINRSVDAP
jgi:crotonobetainyl-CoA:carnitine CoA-transferase CaiB-like acyl-CoA transferase